MQCAVFRDHQAPLVIEHREVPTPMEGELLIKVMACGVCGSDIHAAEGIGMAINPGTILGHEIAGHVVKIGADVPEHWQIGARVCSLPFSSCGNCEHCLNDQAVRCHSMQILGIDQPGGFSEYVRVHHSCVMNLPDNVTWHEGALVEPLAVGLHAVKKASNITNKRALIIGAGPIGLGVGLWVKYFGAAHVVYSVNREDPNRSGKTALFGGTGVINASQDLTKLYADLAGEQPDIIFVCAGAPGLISQAIEWIKFGGEIICLGVSSMPENINTIAAISKDVTLKFSMGEDRSDFQFILDVMQDKKIDATAMISKITPISGFPEVFESLRNTNQHCKVILEP